MTISCDSEPGATTCIKLMYLQAVLGRFQNALCMMEAKVSRANAWEMAPPERKEYMEESYGISTAAAYGLRSFCHLSRREWEGLSAAQMTKRP